MLTKKYSKCTYVSKVECFPYFNIYDYIFQGGVMQNIVFPGVSTACVLVTDSGTGLNQSTDSFISVCQD